jgi:prevent-host-death family protein
MTWNIAQAKQRFSEVVRLTAQEPQAIYNRGERVAVLIDAKEYEAYEAWRKQAAPVTLGAEFAELRRIAAETDYELDMPQRQNRANVFADMLEGEAHAG